MSVRRHSRYLLVAVALLLLAGVVVIGWRWNDRRTERAETLRLAADRKYADAEPRLQALLNRDPDDVELTAAMTRLQIGRGARVVETEPYLTRWCVLRPDDPEPLHLRLDLWLRLMDFPRALADAEQLARLEPTNDDVALLRARLLIRVGRYAEAEAQADRLLATRPNDPELAFVRADVFYQAGAWDRAAAALDPLVARSYAPAIVLRGVLYARTDPPNVERAIPMLQRALNAAGSAGEKNLARYHLAQMLFRAKREDEARKQLEFHRQGQVAERMTMDARQQPGNLDLHVQAARACLTVGLRTDAEDLLNQALARDPDYAPAHRVLAELYEIQGDRTRAAVHRRRAG